MIARSDDLSRIAKLFIDRDDASAEEAEEHLRRFRVLLRCGPEVATSATLQAAVLTAANVANRCFPESVRVQCSHDFPLRLPWTPGATFRTAIEAIVGTDMLVCSGRDHEASAAIAFGTPDGLSPGVQVTFDGWTAAVSPLEEPLRLPERDGCVLAGIAAGALAVSEIFLGSFGFSIEAGARLTGLSLWRPGRSWDQAEATGIDAPICHLPGELWLLGLGHLGQAFTWALSLLPFSAPAQVNIVLQDFDRLVRANLDTGLVSDAGDIGRLKTRIAASFLEQRGFTTRLVERRFDEHTRPQDGEPAVLLAGMDGQGPRHLLDLAGFDLVIDCGVGGSLTSFDSLTMNVLPNRRTTAAALWPPDETEAAARREREARELAASRSVYRTVGAQLGCGHVELAGRSVAVPFVGALAASFALSELIRRLMGGTGYDRVRLQLISPDEPSILISDDSASLRTSSQPAYSRTPVVKVP